MLYRESGSTGVTVSEIGFGGEYLEGKDAGQAERTLSAAQDAGVNLIDVFMSEPQSRAALYNACAAAGVGITVMKSLAAGVLLDPRRSPFGAALTVPQCIHYALSRPAVSSVLVGMQTPKEVAEALSYETLDAAQWDYAPILATRPQFTLARRCMYCGHCLPSPTLNAHYGALSHTAADCIACGACERRCPFGVPVRERMSGAVQLFGI